MSAVLTKPSQLEGQLHLAELGFEPELSISIPGDSPSVDTRALLGTCVYPSPVEFETWEEARPCSPGKTKALANFSNFF
jgi:hypothetical protein